VPGSGARRCEEASIAYNELRLDESRIALDRSMRDPTNSRQQLVEIYRLKGVVEASMGQPIAAKRAFSHMLVLAPEIQLSDELSPKILKAFEAARASLPGERGVLLESAAPDEILMAQATELPIRVNDTLGLVEQLTVRYRVAGKEPTEVILSRTDRGVLKLGAEILPTKGEPYVLEIEAVAQHAFGAELARLETGAEQTQIRVVSELTTEPVAWYQHWWVWASVAGGVAVSAAVAGGLAFALAPPDTSPRDIGVIVE
jgi:hypothetical protein